MNVETTQKNGRQKMGRGRIREEVGSRPAQGAGLGWSSVPVDGSGWSSAAAVRSLRRGRADDAAAAADDEKGHESGLGAVEEGPAEQEEEDSGAEISNNVSCEPRIEAIIDSYIHQRSSNVQIRTSMYHNWSSMSHTLTSMYDVTPKVCRTTLIYMRCLSMP